MGTTINTIQQFEGDLTHERRRELLERLVTARVASISSLLSLRTKFPDLIRESTYIHTSTNAGFVEKPYYYTPNTPDGRAAIILPDIGAFIIRMETDTYGHVDSLTARRLVEESTLPQFLNYLTIDSVLRGKDAENIAANGLNPESILKASFGTLYDLESHTVYCLLDCTTTDDVATFEEFLQDGFESSII